MEGIKCNSNSCEEVFVLFTKYHHGDQINEDEISGACSAQFYSET